MGTLLGGMYSTEQGEGSYIKCCRNAHGVWETLVRQRSWLLQIGMWCRAGWGFATCYTVRGVVRL